MYKLKLLHSILGHINYDYIIKAIKNGAFRDMDINLNDVKDYKEVLDKCTVCVESKMTSKGRKAAISGLYKATSPGGTLHTDYIGPIRIYSKGDKWKRRLLMKPVFIQTVLDEYSNYKWINITETKSSAYEFLTRIINNIEKQTPYKVKEVFSDRGAEFLSSEFT